MFPTCLCVVVLTVHFHIYILHFLYSFIYAYTLRFIKYLLYECFSRTLLLSLAPRVHYTSLIVYRLVKPEICRKNKDLDIE